jgi:hypothetical protein
MKTDNKTHYRKVPLSQGKFAKVSEEDYERISKHKWYAYEGQNGVCYARRSFVVDGIQHQEGMHRFLMGFKKGDPIVDHKDHDGLNNTRENMRAATRSQNGANRRSHKKSSSKYLGVFLSKKRNRFKAEIKKGVKTYFLGWFKDEKEAATAYNTKSKEIFGEFANLNTI